MMRNKIKTYNIPIFIPHEGCPHTCVFCSQQKITGVQTTVTVSDVRRIIEEYLSFLPTEGCRIEAAFFGGSFTGLDLDIQEEFLKTACEYSGRIHGIRMSTRPDYINDGVLRLAKAYNVQVIELGLQSADDKVLEMNERGHTFADAAAASALIKKYGIGLGLQMMVGMYGSTPQKDVETAKAAAALRPDCVRIYPTVTIFGTKLEKLYNSGEYEPYDMETAICVTDKAMRIFEEHDIEIIRVGLHSDEGLQDGGIAAGPYHPAFRELVLCRRVRAEIEADIINNGLHDCVYEAGANGRGASLIIGHKRCNAKYFKDKYNITLRVSPSDG